MTLTHVPVRVDDDDTIAADSTLIIHRPRRRRWWPAAIVGCRRRRPPGGRARPGHRPRPRLRRRPHAVAHRARRRHQHARRVDNALGTEVTVGFERARHVQRRAGAGQPRPVPGQGHRLPRAGRLLLRARERGDGVRRRRAAREPFRLLHAAAGRHPVAGAALPLRRLRPRARRAAPAARTSLPIAYRVFGLHQRQNVPFHALRPLGAERALRPARPRSSVVVRVRREVGLCASPGRRRGLRGPRRSCRPGGSSRRRRAAGRRARRR